MKKYLWIFLISMVPLIELRGAIPVAVGLGLPIVPSIIISVVGNMLPVPFIFLFARRVLEWGKDKKVIGGFFTWCLEKGEKGGRKLEAKAGRGLYWALLLFVGIPIPGTGAWTGTLAASILNTAGRRHHARRLPGRLRRHQSGEIAIRGRDLHPAALGASPALLQSVWR